MLDAVNAHDVREIIVFEREGLIHIEQRQIRVVRHFEDIDDIAGDNGHAVLHEPGRKRALATGYIEDFPRSDIRKGVGIEEYLLDGLMRIFCGVFGGRAQSIRLPTA